jgi:hypothetical protein
LFETAPDYNEVEEEEVVELDIDVVLFSEMVTDSW